MSLLYGPKGHAPAEQEQARNLVETKYKESILEKSFKMDRLELWATGGGFGGISKWVKMGEVKFSPERGSTTHEL
jgi:hypothetical protein